ncbi:MAG TPA: S8 family serine peptidase [Pyrinomonadaceae bacterium]|nr:S8 family serine peptidase [Pyrinomonadaceae bacterium]
MLILVIAIAYASHQPGEAAGYSASGAVVDPVLEGVLGAQSLGATIPAVITYDYQPGSADFARLQSVGITKGFALKRLPMVITDINRAQLAALRTQPGIISIWANQMLENFMNESRAFIGVPQLTKDQEITKRNNNNPGFPISGKGIGIGYVDTGIDGTQPDLKFGQKTVQNVQQPLASGVVSAAGLVSAPGVSIADLIGGTGFVPPLYVENVQTSDIESGHGTHGAGVAAGTGQNSGTFYGGVARGAHLIGVQSGDDKGLPLVALLGAYDYLLVNQFNYNIRIINNSWGSRYSAAGINPNNPINVATRKAHDLNIVVVFAAGNAADTPTSINPYSTMAWTISVAAGEKRGLGTPASFSSRGINNGTGTDTTTQPADPNAAPNLRPDITAPGVAIISVRARAPMPLMNAGGVLNNDHKNIAPGFLPNYLSSQGTSFACPHVSGVVALMLEANPLLTPAEVVTILRQAATPMPYEERIVGAGYLDAHNAVRAAMSLSAVPHPANLFPTGNEPEISDTENDQTGTTAQDIRSGDFAYDAATRQIVYTLTVSDLSVKAPNSRWTMFSKFGATEMFVQASVNEQNTAIYDYGMFTVLATGTRNQQRIGAADAGEIRGNQIIIRLALDKVNAAVGSDVLYTTSTGTGAQSQILVGTSATGGLLLNSDSAAGRDFKVGEQPAPTPTPTPAPEPTHETTPTPTQGATLQPTPTPSSSPEPTPARSESDKFVERYSGTLIPGMSGVATTFVVRRSTLDVIITLHPGNETIILELLDAEGNVIATGSGKDRKIALSDLRPGNYVFRVSGSVDKPVDFVIKSTQGR